MIQIESILQAIEENLVDLAQFLIDELKNELSDQGHVLTGALRDSIEMTALRAGQGNMEAFVELENYFAILDRGVPASRIPFHPGSGRKTSSYIDGLVKFWMIKRGLSEKEAKSAAFATAHKHKKEGMPTQSSWKYSSNGRRMDFFTRTIEDNNKYGNFEENILDVLELASNNALDDFETALK